MARIARYYREYGVRIVRGLCNISGTTGVGGMWTVIQTTEWSFLAMAILKSPRRLGDSWRRFGLCL